MRNPESVLGIVFVICIIIFAYSFEDKSEHKTKTVKNITTINVQEEVTVKKLSSSTDFKIVTIQGHDYVVYTGTHYTSIGTGDGGGGITHSASCKAKH